MITRILATVEGAFTLLRLAGPRIFIRKLLRQFYCRDAQVGMAVDLETYERPDVSCRIQYDLRPATPADMDEVWQLVHTESKESIEILLYMKWLYQCGFRNWYVARTTETSEICFVDSVIGPEDNAVLEKHFKGWFPQLKEGEVLVEGAYAVEKYRGQGITTCANVDINLLCKRQGYKTIILYLNKNNFPSLKLAEKMGFSRFEEVPISKTFFLNNKKFSRQAC